MKFTYDRDTDVLSVVLLPQATSHRTTELDPNSFIDFDIEGRVIGLELLAASERYPSKLLAQAQGAEEWLTLAEAAKEGGIATATLRVLLNAKRIKGRKRGRQWEVSRAELWNYLDNRAPSGKPAKAGRRRTKVAR